MKNYIEIINTEIGDDFLRRIVADHKNQNNNITKEDIVNSIKDGSIELAKDVSKIGKIMWRGYENYCLVYWDAYMAAFRSILKGIKDTTEYITDIYLQ